MHHCATVKDCPREQRASTVHQAVGIGTRSTSRGAVGVSRMRNKSDTDGICRNGKHVSLSHCNGKPGRHPMDRCVVTLPVCVGKRGEKGGERSDAADDWRGPLGEANSDAREKEKLGYASQFVRVILAQGPF